MSEAGATFAPGVVRVSGTVRAGHAVLEDSRGRRWVVEVPRTRRERMRGLRGRDELAPGRALLLLRTRSVQTAGMRFPISAVLLDAHGTVLHVLHVGAGRVTRPRRRVRHVLECPAGTDLRPGDRLSLEPVGPRRAGL